MTGLPTGEPYCLERLEQKVTLINGGNITAAGARTLLVDLAGCFIELGRRQVQMARVITSLHDQENGKGGDWATRSAIWFVNKVLPTLLTSAIILSVAWLAAVNGLLN